MTDAASPTPFAPLLPASPPASSPAASAAPADSTGAGLAARLDEIEIRLSYFEDLLDTLNGLVARQSEQIEALGRELRRLGQRVDAGAAMGAGRSRDGGDGLPAFLDERPPHY